MRKEEVLERKAEQLEYEIGNFEECYVCRGKYIEDELRKVNLINRGKKIKQVKVCPRCLDGESLWMEEE